MADRTSTVRVNVITDASGAGVMLGKFGRVAGLAALGVGALGIGAAVGASKLYDFGDAADDADAKIANVVKTMKLFGKQSDEVTERIQDQAKAISQATAVDINSIKATQAKLLTFKDLAKTADDMGGMFDRATEAAVDMAALGFGTAETNAVQLGKALQDPANGLSALKKTGALTAEQIKSIGDEFNRTGDLAKAQGDILDAVEKQVGGTAEATAGGFEKMKNNLAIFGQELATKALPYLDAFGTFMIEKGGPALADFAATMKDKLEPAFRAFGEFLINQGLPAVRNLGKRFQEDVLPVLKNFGAFIRDNVIPALQDFAGWIMDTVVPVLRENLPPVLKAAKEAFDDVKNAIKRNQPEIKDMFDKLKKVADFIVEKVVPVIADYAETTLPLLGAAIGTAIDVISNMYDSWNNLWDIVKKVVGAIGDVANAITNLPSLPSGLGALVGAATRGSGSSAADQTNQVRLPGGSITINFNGVVTDPRGTAREVEKVLRRNEIALGRSVVG